MIPATCASFWLSSSSSTAPLYWPLEFGVAGRNEGLPPASTPRCDDDPPEEGGGSPYPYPPLGLVLTLRRLSDPEPPV